MRICPKCGKKYPYDRERCNGVPGKPCDTVTIELIDWTEEDEAEAMKDLDDGIMADPFETYVEKPKKEKK